MRPRILVIGALLSLVLFGCGGEVVGDGDTSSGEEATTSSGGGETKDPNDGDPGVLDLTTCDTSPALSCAAVCSHLGGPDCGGDLACTGALWLSGGPGVLQWQNRPGPGNWQGDETLFLLGDGTALLQERSRSCPASDSFCDLGAQPWVVEPAQRCDVVAPVASGACEEGAATCEAYPHVENCAEVEVGCDGLGAAS